jgi:ribosome-associated toxin RatA of RatAB toxin-antitoxin module
MREITRSALVAHPPAQMFALINDIESYPQFVPGCTRAYVEARTEREIVATMAVKRGVMHAEFTTRNELEPDTRIAMKLVRGPFRELEGEWRITPIGTTGSRVELMLRFAFANPVSALLFEPLFEATAASLVDAFVARARGSHA